jgi:hypothetical protein
VTNRRCRLEALCSILAPLEPLVVAPATSSMMTMTMCGTFAPPPPPYPETQAEEYCICLDAAPAQVSEA